jgi:hypothetical protein
MFFSSRKSIVDHQPFKSKSHVARSGQVLSYPQRRLGRGLVARMIEVALEAREQGGRLHGLSF